MNKVLLLAVAAATLISVSSASAQRIYLDFGPNPGYGPPPPGYGGYGPPPGYGPGYGPPGAYYRGGDRGGGYYRPGRYRSWNGCQPGWTVQDGLCKPYRGY